MHGYPAEVDPDRKVRQPAPTMTKERIMSKAMEETDE